MGHLRNGSNVMQTKNVETKQKIDEAKCMSNFNKRLRKGESRSEDTV